MSRFLIALVNFIFFLFRDDDTQYSDGYYLGDKCQLIAVTREIMASTNVRSRTRVYENVCAY